MRVVITGACGFIGHFLTAYLFENTTWDLILIDELSYASKGLQRLKETLPLKHARVHLFTFDLMRPLTPGLTSEIGRVDYIIHLAAETHVDRSIAQPVEVVSNNILSTLHLLEWTRHCQPQALFLYFGTDEVYGPARPGHCFSEEDRFHPNNPYAAAKAGSECLVQSYANTYKLRTLIVHCTNVYGPRQHCEKFIPLVISKVLAGETVTIHGYPDRTSSGSRYYIHVADVARAVKFLLQFGIPGESYNITGDAEISNLELAQKIAQILEQELKYEIVDYHSARPGHDLHYGLCGDKLRRLGWRAKYSFAEGLEEVVKWTLEHPEWLQ